VCAIRPWSMCSYVEECTWIHPILWSTNTFTYVTSLSIVTIVIRKLSSKATPLLAWSWTSSWYAMSLCSHKYGNHIGLSMWHEEAELEMGHYNNFVLMAETLGTIHWFLHSRNIYQAIFMC
jgi:hypothetical protein